MDRRILKIVREENLMFILEKDDTNLSFRDKHRFALRKCEEIYKQCGTVSEKICNIKDSKTIEYLKYIIFENVMISRTQMAPIKLTLLDSFYFSVIIEARFNDKKEEKFIKEIDKIPVNFRKEDKDYQLNFIKMISDI